MKTKIEWADDTENAASGCSEAVLPSGKMDPACVNCYARLQSARCASMGMALYDGVAERTGNAARWTGVFRWDRDMLRNRFDRMKGGHRVFLGSMTDLWHEKHDPGLLVALAEEIRALGNRPPEKRPSVITLTKRADRLLAWQRAHFPDGLPAWHWPGVTAGCQEAVNERIPLLLQVLAEGPRVVSVEPVTGPVELDLRPRWQGGCVGGCLESDLYLSWDGAERCKRCEAPLGGTPAPAIGWCIGGGESGPKARPTHPDWFRSLRDQCVAAGVPYLHKQHGEWAEVDPDGRDPVTGGPVMRDPDDPNDAATFIEGLSAGISLDGRVALSLDAMEDGVAYRHVQRVGKKAAGRLLDGREWNEVPNVF